MLSIRALQHQKTNIIAQLTLHLREIMLAKLDEFHPWHYIHLPNNLTKEVVVKTMHDFIMNHLEPFVERYVAVLVEFTETDSASIGSPNPTANATKFMDLLKYLEQNGFSGVTQFNKPLNFWSGQVAKNRALHTKDEVTDSHIPAIAVMFDVATALVKLQGTYNDDITLLTCTISRLYASFASKRVNVYISSDKLSETPGLTVGNNFWLAELPTLLQLHHYHLLEDISIHCFDHFKQEWQPAYSFFSSEINDLPIRRRTMHSLDRKKQETCFKSQSKALEDQKKWAASKPRPYISYGSLKCIARQWRLRAKNDVNVEAETKAFRKLTFE